VASHVAAARGSLNPPRRRADNPGVRPLPWEVHVPAWSWLAALAALALLTPLVRLLVAATVGDRIGERALARQPDAIHLEPETGGAWSANPHWSPSVTALTGLGFADAGTFKVREMPGVVVRLLAHPGEDVYASLYEHPVGGRWLTYVTRYQDGSSASFTTLRPTGLDPRPGDTSVHAPGADAAALHRRLLAERPARPRLPASAAHAVEDFERAYAEQISWRKDAGVSRREVMRVATRRKVA